MTPREAVLTEERRTVARLIHADLGLVDGYTASQHPLAPRLEELTYLIGRERWCASVDQSSLFTDGTVWPEGDLELEMAA